MDGLKKVYGFTIPEMLDWNISLGEWMERWNKNAEGGDVGTAVGLLHCIYNSNKGESAHEWPYGYHTNRALFLLTLADGWQDYYGLSNAGGSKLNLQVREKALSMLVSHFFAQNDTHDKIFHLADKITETLFVFFLNEARGDRSGTHRNVEWNPDNKKHTMSVVSAWMKKFCLVHWESSPTRRLRVLELLQYHNALLILQPSGEFSERKWLAFGEPAQKKLEEFALKEHPTVEEAVYHCNQAAMLLTTVRAAHAGYEREETKKQLAAEIESKTKQLKALTK